MQKFVRIVQEALVMGGQARIRDTGITVNEIVRLSLEGKSQAEILVQFPDLEAEDVHQALASSLLNSNMMNVNSLQELSREISSIDAYSTIFLSDFRSDELNSEKIAGTILLNAQRLRYKSTFYIQRGRLLYPWYEVTAPSMIKITHLELELKSSIAPFAPFPELKIDQNILNLKLDSRLAMILGFLTQQRKSTITIKRADNAIVFQLEILEPFELKDEPVYGTINVASELIRRNNSELKIQQEETHVIFEFALPIVEEE